MRSLGAVADFIVTVGLGLVLMVAVKWVQLAEARERRLTWLRATLGGKHGR